LKGIAACLETGSIRIQDHIITKQIMEIFSKAGNAEKVKMRGIKIFFSLPFLDIRSPVL
jgi:hypothetical protein